MKTLSEAAAAYCAQRETVLEVGRKLAAIGACQDQESADYDDGGRCTYPGRDICTERLRYRETVVGNPWWKATADEIETHYCSACRAKVPLWRERRAMKARLAGLMRSMRMAYRREAAKAEGR